VAGGRALDERNTKARPDEAKDGWRNANVAVEKAELGKNFKRAPSWSA